jgi:hypothetical protein
MKNKNKIKNKGKQKNEKLAPLQTTGPFFI